MSLAQSVTPCVLIETPVFLVKQTSSRRDIPMDSKVYLDKKVQQAHYQNLLCEAEKRRLLAQLPRHRHPLLAFTAVKLGVLLVKLGTRLKQIGLTNSMLEDYR